jgi:menaquinone-dependent protoporphyrinogen oxidase
LKACDTLEVFVARVLIVYESKYGQTEKIAKFLYSRLLGQGHSVNLMNLGAKDFRPPTDYDGIIVGAGIYMQRYPKNLEKWVQTYYPTLSQRSTAFFSVCMAVLDKNLKVQRDLQRIANKFFDKTNWHPKRREVFAGALNYSKYGWVTKQLMGLISRASRGDYDTSRDYEYTNWSEVAQFSDDFLSSLSGGREASREIHTH